MDDFDGGTHAMRIYLAPDGKGKAQLSDADGEPLASKKSAVSRKSDTASCGFHLWGSQKAR